MTRKLVGPWIFFSFSHSSLNFVECRMFSHRIFIVELLLPVIADGLNFLFCFISSPKSVFPCMLLSSQSPTLSKQLLWWLLSWKGWLADFKRSSMLDEVCRPDYQMNNCSLGIQSNWKSYQIQIESNFEQVSLGIHLNLSTLIFSSHSLFDF